MRTFVLPWRIPVLAAQVHLSTYYFARVFKQTMGVTPHQFIINLRLAAAAQFLAGSTLTIADIAYRTGFASQSQLAKLFRRWMGSTPSEYRRCIRTGRRPAEAREQLAARNPNRLETARKL